MLALLAGCTRVPPLANTRPSSEALAADVLAAFARQDRDALEALALSEREFRDHVWPELPAARPERNLPFSFVWGDLHQKSRVGLATALLESRGHRFTLERVTFTGTTTYATYRVHREATFHVRDGTGETVALRMCGSMIEKDGGWKVFSYVIDD